LLLKFLDLAIYVTCFQVDSLESKNEYLYKKPGKSRGFPEQ
jgi:hypothetical protein